MEIIKRHQPMGAELVKRGLITESDVEQALAYQKLHQEKKIGEILNILKVCDSTKLIEQIGDIIGVKGIILSTNKISINVFDYISPEIARRNKVIPFEIRDNKIMVCFSDTTNSRNIEAVRLLMLNKGLIMEPFITFEGMLLEVLKELTSTSASEITNISEDENITGTIDNIIKTAMKKRASDIHIEPLKDEIRIRYRIDGELYTEMSLPKDRQSQVIGRLKAISNMHQEKQESQDGRIILYEDYNIRVSSQKNIYGEKFVLRLLKKNSNIQNIFELGFPGNEKDVNRAINKRNSITVIAAPTGEGKTTSLYSFIDFLNRPEVNITTIEDPVEIRIDGLNQIEVDNKSTFSGSLRTVLRQDPDIILVGEIRDKETAEIAVQAGQTGHYVLSTIHTIDAVEVITRLRKMGLSDYDIASTLATTISQRLVRRVCPHCRQNRPYTEQEIQTIQTIGERYGVQFNFEGKTTYEAIGCSKCNNTGYLERIGIFEILELDDEIKELIMNGASSITIKKAALQKSYKPLVIDGINKVLSGVTTLDELNRKILIF